jgi:hypothetical protein
MKHMIQRWLLIAAPFVVLVASAAPRTFGR